MQDIFKPHKNYCLRLLFVCLSIKESVEEVIVGTNFCFSLFVKAYYIIFLSNKLFFGTIILVRTLVLLKVLGNNCEVHFFALDIWFHKLSTKHKRKNLHCVNKLFQMLKNG